MMGLPDQFCILTPVAGSVHVTLASLTSLTVVSFVAKGTYCVVPVNIKYRRPLYYSL